MIFKYISCSVLLVSLAVGIFFVYAYGTDLKTIYVYPTPENVNAILFQDEAKNCFSVQPHEVKCPSNSGSIKTIPVQRHLEKL